MKRTMTSLAIAAGIVAFGVWSVGRSIAQEMGPGTGPVSDSEFRPLVAAARVAANAAVDRIGEDARDVFDTRYSIVPDDAQPSSASLPAAPSIFAKKLGTVVDPNHVDLPAGKDHLSVQPSTSMKLNGIAWFGSRALASIDTGSGARPYAIGDVVGLTKIVAIGRDSVTLADGTVLTLTLSPTIESMSATAPGLAPTPVPPYGSTNGPLPNGYGAAPTSGNGAFGSDTITTKVLSPIDVPTTAPAAATQSYPDAAPAAPSGYGSPQTQTLPTAPYGGR